MPKPSTRVIVAGSQKKAPRGITSTGKIDPEDRVEVSVRVRRKRPLPPVGARRFSREGFSAKFGADPKDLALVEAFAHEHGLDVVQTSRSQRSVVVSGTAAQMKAAFGVTLKSYGRGKHQFRGRSGAITVPRSLAKIVEGVFGLDNRPQARPHFRLRPNGRKFQARANGARAFTPPEVAKLYGFPTKADGKGQCIAILELGGGYRVKDLATYFKSIGIAAPAVSAVSVLGGHNSPTGNPDGPDGEVMLDIEVAGAIAPGAKIAVYFAPNTDDGFVSALRAAVHDSLRRPSVVSISWGAAETDWTDQAMADFDQACQEAAHMGVTVCASSGDHGSSDVDPNDNVARADFPASSPYVLACGGTRLLSRNGVISDEFAWNSGDGWATGGGISRFFARPSYQNGFNVPASSDSSHKRGRGVPDIAGNADSDTGYKMRVDGVNTVSGGTSAVSPLWSALIALINQRRSAPVGFLHSKLYKAAKKSSVVRDIIKGDNGKYKARKGWDACTGLGSPNGKALSSSL